MATPKDVLAFMDEIGGSDNNNNKRKYASLISHLYRIAVKRWGRPLKIQPAALRATPMDKPAYRAYCYNQHLTT